jgi:hypothetical protein
MAPMSQAVVDRGSSLNAAISRPSLGCLARMRCSRRAFRRSNSRRAEAPGVPASMTTGTSWTTSGASCSS